MKITPHLFEAYLKCPTKCWLRATSEPPSGNTYAEWVQAQNESYRSTESERLLAEMPPGDSARSPSAENLKASKWRLAVDVVAQASVPLKSGGASSASPTNSSDPGPRVTRPSELCLLESRLHTVERIPSEGRGKAAQFIPVRFIFRNKLTKDDKLLLAFDALTLSAALGREITTGKIIHGDTCGCARESAAETSRSVSTLQGVTPSEHAKAWTPNAGDPHGTGIHTIIQTCNESATDLPTPAAGEQPGMTTAAFSRTQPRVTKVKTSALAGEVRKRLEKIAALLATTRSADSHVREALPDEETRGLGGPRSGLTPPDLVLNRHCGECEFQARCRQKALETDDLSLLAGMNAKERQKLRSKGIFTVTQLSYTFRPRRRPKRLRDKREKYHHSLKALAIREKKIHIVGSPELKIEGTPVYLDVEGLPDRDFYYLIGLRIGNGDSAIQHSLWADTVADEGKIWWEFLAILETVEKPVLIHYGSYETTFLKRMGERHGDPPEGSTLAKTVRSGANLLSHIFAQIYFAGFSNGLKDTAGTLDFKWSEASPSGLKTITWRCQWERLHEAVFKERLTKYNSQDCEALSLVSDTVRQLVVRARDGNRTGKAEVVRADADEFAKRSKWGAFASSVSGFEYVNSSAHWNYQRNRIYARSGGVTLKPKERLSRRRFFRRVEMMVHWKRSCVCPKCNRRYCTKDRVLTRTLQDILFGRHSLKRRLVRYVFQAYHCRRCGNTFGLPERFRLSRKYGWNLAAYFFYQVVDLCIPQRVAVKCFNRTFGFELSRSTLGEMKIRVAKYYTATKERILERIIRGGLVHADETRANIKGKSAFVWVLTSFREVVYIYSDSREGEIVQKLLTDFKGVLVTDFYTAYDSINCPQQKCLIHLMRDLNDEVLNNPFDEQLKQMTAKFGNLLKSVVETVDRYGLKTHYLRKHLKTVENFYRELGQAEYQSEAALKVKERFERNRNTLFTFLSHDGVPWNNNNAEHAVKAFARLRDVIAGSSTERGVEQYLTLLSVCETCKYMGVDFLDFLRSGEQDLHAFAESRRGRRRRTQTSQTTQLPPNAVSNELGGA